MSWHTVKRFADAATPEELFTGQWENRPSVLDDYEPCLDDRWNEGCTIAWKLWQEVVPLGYKGSYQRVRTCTASAPHRGRWPPGRPRLGSSPDGSCGTRIPLTEAEQLRLKAVRTRCSGPDALIRHVRSFAVMLTGWQAERLPDWLDAVRHDGLPSMHTLGSGIDRDRDAVIGARHALELGCPQGPREPDLDAQASDVRPCRLCPPAEASRARAMEGVPVHRPSRMGPDGAPAVINAVREDARSRGENRSAPA